VRWTLTGSLSSTILGEAAGDVGELTKARRSRATSSARNGLTLGFTRAMVLLMPRKAAVVGVSDVMTTLWKLMGEKEGLLADIEKMLHELPCCCPGCIELRVEVDGEEVERELPF